MAGSMKKRPALMPQPLKFGGEDIEVGVWSSTELMRKDDILRFFFFFF